MNFPPATSSLRFVRNTVGHQPGQARFDAISGGRNSRVYRIVPKEGPSVILKEYAPDFATRETLSREFESFQLLHRHGISHVPDALFQDATRGVALYSDLGGKAPNPVDLGDDAFDPLVDFVQQLKALPVDEFPRWAKDASSHPTALIEQIEQRLTRFPATHSDLCGFLDSELRPKFAFLREKALRDLLPFGPFDQELAASKRILSPSDFGFHNSILRDNRSLAFVDFEFFGQDDPAKLLADMLLHPGMSTSANQRNHLKTRFLALFSDEAGFEPRFDALFPLAGIKWCCILLNEFVPMDKVRRDFSGCLFAPKEEVLQTQLSKARNLLDNLWQSQVLSKPSTEAMP